jgi:hypothetical protein
VLIAQLLFFLYEFVHLLVESKKVGIKLVFGSPLSATVHHIVRLEGLL